MSADFAFEAGMTNGLSIRPKLRIPLGWFVLVRMALGTIAEGPTRELFVETY